MLFPEIATHADATYTPTSLPHIPDFKFRLDVF
jgi:hypothetical protein